MENIYQEFDVVIKEVLTYVIHGVFKIIQPKIYGD